MTDKYSSDLCRIVIAQITQTIGYSSTLSAPLELLQDIMQKFMHEFARDLHGHMEHANRLQPSVKDARHSLKSLNINIQELLDYIGNVEPVSFTRDVPKFPIKGASNMNFLKPGSAETLMRPIHIFDYLPPMQESESTRETEKTEPSQNQDNIGANTEINDKLGSFNHIDTHSPIPSKLHFPSSNNISNFDSDVNRSSLWELSSVVMTTGGFISPAIEGKLPEACVPDIIEMYKGLDAPPLTSLVLQPLACSPKLETRKLKSQQQEPEIDNCRQISTSISAANASADLSLLLRPNNNATTPKVSSKKNKKQKDDLNRDKNDIKLQEKAQRRAMKLYQKLAKNQNDESQMLNLKKSKKLSSSDSNKVQQLQKLMKKQAKQRQKQLKGLTIEDKGLSYVETPQDVNTNVNLITENQTPVERSTEMISAVSSNQNETDQNSEFILAESKKNCEPERNKLDIFKKITKQRVVLPTNNAFGNQAMPGNPPVISLPSGTTITPTIAPTPLPLVGVNSETTKSNFNTLAQRTSPEISPVDVLIKPKKRGRKPGGKNQIKPSNLSASQSLITLPIPHLINAANLTTEQPLNLSHSTDQTMNLISKSLQLKEKKERKKGKLKYETSNLMADNSTKETSMKIMHSSPDKNISSTKMNVLHDQFMTPPNSTATISSAPFYSAHQGGGMVAMPLLPLLHFPPQPGLIPTGPPAGLFPGVVTGLVGFGAGTNTNKIGAPPFFAFSGPPDSSVAVKDDDATDSDQLKLFRRKSSQADLQPEIRNYCNVAPLVPPESMKLTECAEVSFAATNLDNPYAQTPQKGKATGNLGDPIEVSDDSDEAIENSRKPLIMPKPETPESFDDKSHLDLRNLLPIPSPHSSGDRDKVKQFKSPVKLSLINSAPHSSSSTSSISSTSPFPSRFQLPNFISGGDKFSLAGGADLIPLSRMDCGSAYSSQKVPSNSLTAQHNFNDDHQSFMPKFPTYEDITITPTGVTASSTDLKQRKHHKKPKKIKDGKVKKKKDKKEKSKEKDLIIGEGITVNSFKSDKKIKGLEKKQKKKKDKLQTTSIIHIPDDDGDEVLPLINNIERGPASNLFVGETPVTAISPKSTPTPPPTQIPKLTLKLSGKSTPIPLTNDMMDNETPPTIQRQRDHSPELARFSPLVTGPPKTKQSDSAHLLSITSTATAIAPLLGNFSGSSSGNLSSSSSVNTTAVQMPSLLSAPINTRTIHQPIAPSSSGWMSISNNITNTSDTSTLSASSVLLPQQLMLMTTPKPIINNFPSINVAGTAGRTTLSNNPPESPSPILETKSHRPSSYVDAEGNRIWICPACGKVDDGSAMIGCDGCDAWYHWICVGITIAPKDNDDWFCRVCITKKKVFGSDKKAKKRNKKK